MNIEKRLAIRRSLRKPWYTLLHFLYGRGIVRVYVVRWPDFMADVHDPGDVGRMEFKSGKSYNCRFLKSEMYRGEEDVGIYEMTRDIQELAYDQFYSVARGCGIRFSRLYRKEEKKNERP